MNADLNVKTWSIKVPAFVGLIALFGLFGGFIAWATLTQIAGAIISPGPIEVDQNRQVIQHSSGGIVSEILVREGDVVRAGDVLLRLDDQQLNSQLMTVERQLFELIARRSRLIAERDGAEMPVFDDMLLTEGSANSNLMELLVGQKNLFHARRDSVAREKEQQKKRKTQIKNQIIGITAQETSLVKQLELIEQELKTQENLQERGLAQLRTVLALKRQSANLNGQVGETSAMRAHAEGRITEIDLEILKLGTNRREDAITRLRDIRYRETEMDERRKSLQLEIEQLNIRAPVSGIVYGMVVQTIRSVIRAADPVLYLIPQDRPLLIVARVDPIHIDKIAIGQQVDLRFPALDQSTTPEVTGQVTVISADTFYDEALGVSYYRAEIDLNHGELLKTNSRGILIPGMPVEAFIRTENRSPLAYLIKPINDYFTKAFRE